MRSLLKIALVMVFVVLFFSCSDEDSPIVINQGDYPLKGYYLERDPRVNVWGAGMDFVHDECELTETELDYEYLEETDDFAYDIKFFVVKSYYYDENDELQNEGCPAMLLSPDTKGCKIGEGVTFFDTLSIINEEMMDGLVSEPEVNYSLYKDEETGFYEREALYAAIDQCVIGQSFRSNVLVVPDDKTEEEVQAVYLVKTAEGAYVKFMVEHFKPAKPNEKTTQVRWQIISL